MENPELDSFFTKRKSRKGMYYLLGIFLLLCSPILLFIGNFNLGFFESVSDWADVGSFFGGIYSPILSFFTLFILVFQSSIMKSQMKLMETQTQLQVTQLEIQKTMQEKEDAAQRSTRALTSSSRIDSALQLEINVKTGLPKNTREYLISAVLLFENAPQKFNVEKKKHQKALHAVYTNWVLVLANIWDIDNVVSDENLRKNNQESICLEVVTLLGFETCLYLDKFLFAIGHPYSNKEKYPPFFWSKN
ncbi:MULTISPECIES: hypothetical protein [Pseudoalteromonas]|uniref:hypothetical protein n=1 Tax=Pseudoalteromonas TaxID=53246 RepID=UPI000C343C23|nr:MULTISPECIES: hypothetical protein [Pseudoalteromonas]PKG63273.1 hypothetical protein CXF75_15470 [Pseudoalteromonas arctica]PKG69588.1 hypothetical protein CXF64_14900 [Pseudoalteromonas sp. GutCa3]